MTPGEALIAHIFGYVKSVVPPELVEPVTKATAEAVATLMSDPGFTSGLRIVNDLRQENQWLKSQIVQLQRILSVSASAPTSPPRKRGSTSKKVSPRPVAPSAKRSSAPPPKRSSPTLKKNFNQGVRQARKK